MKSFIFKTTAFLVIISIIFFYILSGADGHVDAFYKRFTTAKQTHLILGTSRSAQGIQPSVLKQTLNREFFNYSFSIAHSPFGPVYLNSIKKKLKPETENGIFILTVDPWSISSKTKDPNDISNFRENNLCLGNTNFVNMNPNFEYLLKNLKGQYYSALNVNTRDVFLHDDGWLEVNVPMDSISIRKRIDSKINEYRTTNLPFFKFSSVRLNYLKQTVEYLKLHGKVYMVRLPMHPEIFKIDSELLPEFNDIISPIIPLANGYLDMTNENDLYQYTDGNHIHKESGKLVSKKIADWIKNGPNPQD